MNDWMTSDARRNLLKLALEQDLRARLRRRDEVRELEREIAELDERISSTKQKIDALDSARSAQVRS